MNRSLLFLLCAANISLVACQSNLKDYKPDITKYTSPKGTDVFKPDSAIIATHYNIPEWFRDAKFGIFIHWGVYSVPAYGSEWYSRHMYEKGSDMNIHHEKVYGSLTEFGYKDFIPMFKAEKFDAEEWAELFKESGAKYVVPVAEHHDGFAMYKSSFNPWNAVDMGPKRDIVGELKKAVSDKNMRFGVSSHRAENAWFYEHGMKQPSDVQDTTISLYGERLHEPDGASMSPEYVHHEGSNERSRIEFLKHTYELIDQYEPDLIWFDWTVGKKPFQSTFYQFMAYYYNSARDWGREVVVNTKFGYGDNIQVYDIERGKSDEIRKYPWQTDTSIGTTSWSFKEGEVNKTPDHVIDDFVDIVSKNGNLLLNIGPKADGTITDEQQHVLREIGKWLLINGEAIFYSRPWRIAEEGATKGTSGYMTDHKKTEYTGADIRFTTRGEYLYAILLSWPGDEAFIKSLAEEAVKQKKIESVSILGYDNPLEYTFTTDGLRVFLPKQKPSEYAHVLKIKLTDTE